MITWILQNSFQALVSSALSAVIGYFCFGKGFTPESLAMCASAVVAIVLAVNFAFNKLRNKFIAAQDFDFKFFADYSEGKVTLDDLFKFFGRTDFDAIGPDPLVLSSLRAGSAKRLALSARSFFDPKGPFMKIFSCRSIRNYQKSGKVFVQLSFLPVDCEGNTLLIKRVPYFHPSDFAKGKDAGNDWARLSFISFSPVPSKYLATGFSHDVCYHNEVPVPWGKLAGTRIDFEEMGCAIRRDMKRNAIYLFFIFKVKYPEVSFGAKTDGEPNIKWLFYEDDEAFAHKRAFLKDHDAIAAVAPLETVRCFVTTKQLPLTGRNVFGAKFRRTMSLRRILSHLKPMPLENKVLSELQF